MSDREESKSNDIPLRPGEREAKCEYGGEIVGQGLTSVVERLPNGGDIIKTPWPDCDEYDDNCKQLAIEAKVYQRLGEHPRLVKFKGWNPATHALTLEYIPCNLETYLKRLQRDSTFVGKEWSMSVYTCVQWIDQIAEGLSLLHSKGVVHCDVAPRNMLLDADMNIKIAGFSGSSINGSRALVCADRRYRLPCYARDEMATVTVDLFGLGSIVYFLVTGEEPYREYADYEVEEIFQVGIFPDLTDVMCEEIIRLCWYQEAESAQHIREVLAKIEVGEFS
jgi:serine/threonine protein kinase